MESAGRGDAPSTAPSSSNMLLEMEDFTSLKQIGKGKDCVVYAANCPKLNNCMVVLKVYDKTIISAVKQRSIRREARIMRYLTETRVPHVCRYIGAFQNSASIYIVMEHCGGGDLLEQLLREGRAMTEKRVVREVVLPILTGLSYMHAAGIIHRDIKLENLFVSSQGQLQLGDFGLALCIHEENAISPVGTLEYMPPEILCLPTTDLVIKGIVKAEDITPVDFKVDLWSFGVTVYELVTGRSPFEGANKDEIRQNILKHVMRPLPSFLTTDCRDFIHKCLTPNAAGRPGSLQLLNHPWTQRHLASVDASRVLQLPNLLPKIGMSCSAPAPRVATAAEAAAGSAAAAGGGNPVQLQVNGAAAAAAESGQPAPAAAAAGAAAGSGKGKDPSLLQSGSPVGTHSGIKAYVPSGGSSSMSSSSTSGTPRNPSGLASDISASTSRESNSSRVSGGSGASVADSATSFASGQGARVPKAVTPSPISYAAMAPSAAVAGAGPPGAHEPIQEGVEDEHQAGSSSKHSSKKRKSGGLLKKLMCLTADGSHKTLSV